jgi:hypothetical protein
MEGGYFCIIMKIKNIFLTGTAIIPLLPGCALTPVTLDSIGPAPENGKPSDYAPMGSGWLRVYTATKRHEIGDNTFFYSHTGYRICTKDGQLWKFIPKNTDNMDEAASIVEIPAGDYRIFAQSQAYNLVSVPVVIQAGKTTEVHLGTHWKAPVGTSTNEIVYFPDGWPVGWKSTFTNNNH